MTEAISNRRKRKWKNSLTAYAFLFPASVLIFVFVIYPFLNSIYLSFFDLRTYSDNLFVGWKNYSIVLNDREFWTALKVGFSYVGILVPCQFILGFILALIIKSGVRGTKLIKSTIYIPNMISGIVVGTIFLFIFSFDTGLLNKFIGIFGVDPISFTTEFPMLTILIPGIWLGLGYVTLVLLAGLNEIPKTYYECAKIDGASNLRAFFTITLPLMKNTLIFLLVTSVAGSLQQYELSMMITGDLYDHATTTPNYYIYNLLIYSNRRPQAIVASLLMFIILGTLSAIMMSLMKSERSQES